MIWEYIVTNNGLLVLLVIAVSVLLSKFFKLFFYRNARDALLAGGGMPSSHCASASSLVVMILLLEGFTTTFALAASFGVVVFIDAVRVRRAVGINADALKDLAHHDHHKESIMVEHGHTIPEAIVGTLLGIAVAVSTYLVIM